MQASMCTNTAPLHARRVLWPPAAHEQRPARTECFDHHVDCREAQQRRRCIGCRWSAKSALAAPVQPWPSAWRCSGPRPRQHGQGDLLSSAGAPAATDALTK